MAVQEAFRPFIQGYDDLRHQLEAAGFQITVDPDLFPTVAPIQLTGLLFRGRGTACSLQIAPPDGDPVVRPPWQQGVERWTWPQAGCLEAAEAEAVLRDLLAAYRTH